MSRRRTTRGTRTPALVPLRFGKVYCELCRRDIYAGERVAWWLVRGRGNRTRWAAYCPDCHHANVRKGNAIR